MAASVRQLELHERGRDHDEHRARDADDALDREHQRQLICRPNVADRPYETAVSESTGPPISDPITGT
jgi:hypothetical protein